MATPTIGLLNHQSINTAESTSGWSTFDTLDTDIKKEGSNGITGTFRSDGTSGYYTDPGGAPVTAVGKHIRMWINTTSVPYLDTEANGGFELLMNDGSTTQYYTIFSKDDYYGGWFNAVVDCSLFNSLTLANVERWGVRVQYTSNAKNVDNVWVDYLRYLDGYYVTGGSSSDSITLTDIATADRGTTTLYGYGIIEEVEGVFLAFGKLQLGNGSTTTYFEMEGEVLVFTDQPVADGLYLIDGNGSGVDIYINGSTIKSAGTSSDTRFDVDMSTNSPGSVEITGNSFQRGGTFKFTSGQTVTGNTFTDCQLITVAGADLSNCNVFESAVAADEGAILWNVNTDPDTYMDGMVFTKGTNDHHAIRFGANIPSEITLRNCVFNGFSSSNDVNGSIFRFDDTSGSITLNLVNCSTDGVFSVDDAAGCTVSVVIDPVTTKVVVIDHNSDELENARVYLKASNGTGDFPFEETVTSISRSGTTATVAHTAHGMKSGEKIKIAGITDKIEDNAGVHTITVTGADSYTYTTTDSGSTSYTGTIKVTGVLIEGLTNSSGEISFSRSWTNAQPVTGFIRKSSTSPRYKTFPLTGTVSTSIGLTLNAKMILDE